MSGNLVLAGPLIVDELVAESTEADRGTRTVLGGLVHALAGARRWVRECRAVANAGRDLAEWHGPWFAANGIDTAGVRERLPVTLRSRLRYVHDGLFVEEPVHDPETLRRIRELDLRTVADVLARVDEETIGVYLEASAADPIWDSAELDALASRMPVMWEVESASAFDPGLRARVLEIASRTGLYSVNLPEAQALFGVSGQAAAEAAILAHGAACYLRLGAVGSSFLADGRAHFSPSAAAERVVDATGCGNASTAGALAALALGEPPERVAELGNLSAAVVIASYGPPAILP